MTPSPSAEHAGGLVGHAVAQQVVPTQLPETHSAPAPHVCPFAFWTTHVPPEHV
jgi:hypothetical protein